MWCLLDQVFLVEDKTLSFEKNIKKQYNINKVWKILKYMNKKINIKYEI